MCVPLKGDILENFDIFGREATEQGIVKTVDDPLKTFEKDPKMMLTALRLSAALDYTIDPKTLNAAYSAKAMLKQLSSEEIKSEFERFIVLENAGKHFAKNKEIWFEIFPEFKPCIGFNQHNPNHCYDVFYHIMATVDEVEPKLNLRLAAFFHDVAKPVCLTFNERNMGRFYGHTEKSADMAKDVLERLNFDNDLISNVCKLISLHNISKRDSDEYAKMWIMKSSKQDVLELLELVRADCFSHDSCYHDRLLTLSGLKTRIEKMLLNDGCFFVNELDIDDGDLINLGISGQSLIETTKATLLHKVVFEDLKNNKDMLSEKAIEIVNCGVFCDTPTL